MKSKVVLTVIAFIAALGVLSGIAPYAEFVTGIFPNAKIGLCRRFGRLRGKGEGISGMRFAAFLSSRPS
jgi:hypothetical protein